MHQISILSLQLSGNHPIKLENNILRPGGLGGEAALSMFYILFIVVTLSLSTWWSK